MRQPNGQEPLCKHGVVMGALDAYLAEYRGHGRAAACPACWPEFRAAESELPDLSEALAPGTIEEIEQQLWSMLDRRRSPTAPEVAD
jgi:hypothetical protein